MTGTTTAPPRATTSLTVPRAIVRHGTHPLCDVADLRLEPGRPLTIVGESGSGKSVLAHALMGTLPPELVAEGTMTIGEERFDLAEPSRRRRLWGREIALLPQEPSRALDPTMRVLPQVAEGVRGWRPRSTRARGLAADRLTSVGLGEVAAAYPHTLSGGMAQRVAYAAATAGGARILIVDEPSKGLDAASLDRLADLLEAHVAEGGLLLTITHDLRLARRLGGEVAVMREATVVESGDAVRVLDSPGHEYTRRLVDSEPSRWTFDWMAEPAVDATAAPLVSATGIAKSYAGSPVFDDVSLEIRPRERWALTGPSGSGKTTLGNALLRLIRVDAGTVVHADALGRGGAQKLYQDPGASFPARARLGDALGDVARRHRVEPTRIPLLLERVGVSPDLLSRRPGQVSGGELQRVALVRAMLPRPALLFADEATSRLDLATQAVTMDLLMTEVESTGCALLVVTHDEALAAAITDHRLRLDG